ncbi:sensor histidine kinase [Streptosporangium vulgare]|uniref:sensor histidine kinase n=1 Tax=Streptosporangium vulgare TaxID=46190 RepID=UPI0031E233C0
MDPVSAVPAGEVVTAVTSAGVAAAFVGAGLVAVRVRPRNRVGPLMVVIGLLWLLARFAPLPETAAGVRTALAGAWAAVLAHLVVAFPGGRLTSRLPRAVAGTAYLSTAGVAVLATTGLASSAVVRGAATAGAVLSGLALMGLQVSRWRASSVTRRRSLNPVLAAAVVVTALFVTLKPMMIAGVAVRSLTPVMQVALAAVPLAYLGGLLRRRIDRGGVAELVVHLRDVSRPVSIQRALAEVLHDPTLRVGYWMPESSRYVDADGRVVLPPDGGDRVATRADHDGAPLALLVHDPALLDNPELVEATCAAAALALSNERLAAELRARLHQLAESRGQVLRAAETERRRLERDLHDGVQQRLLSIPMTLSLAESRLSTSPDQARELVGEAKTTTLAVLDELRALSQGIHPPVLTERGLRGAVRELAALAPVPLRLSFEIPAPLPVEVETTAYYVVAEAVANVTKHAGAREARVRASDEAGGLLVEISDDGRAGSGTRPEGPGCARSTGRQREVPSLMALRRAPVCVSHPTPTIFPSITAPREPGESIRIRIASERPGGPYPYEPPPTPRDHRTLCHHEPILAQKLGFARPRGPAARPPPPVFFFFFFFFVSPPFLSPPFSSLLTFPPHPPELSFHQHATPFRHLLSAVIPPLCPPRVDFSRMPPWCCLPVFPPPPAAPPCPRALGGLSPPCYIPPRSPA